MDKSKISKVFLQHSRTSESSSSCTAKCNPTTNPNGGTISWTPTSSGNANLSSISSIWHTCWINASTATKHFYAWSNATTTAKAQQNENIISRARRGRGRIDDAKCRELLSSTSIGASTNATTTAAAAYTI